MARILIVDDEPLVCEIVRETLDRTGHETVTAGNGDEGLKAYRENPTDIVITDIFMPEKEGLEMIRDLRQEYPGVKIIAMSGGSPIKDVDVFRWAKFGGADYALEKPVKRQDLLRVVGDCLADLADRQVYYLT